MTITITGGADDQIPQRSSFIQELRELIDKYGMESRSGTPDFVLAHYLIRSMVAFESAVRQRDAWLNPQPSEYDRDPRDRQPPA